MSDFIALEFDAERQIRQISGRLGSLSDQAKPILRNSINSAARKVRKRMVKDALGKYAISNTSLLKDTSKGAPKLQTARESDPTAVIRSKGPKTDLMDFMVNPGSSGVQAKVLKSSGMKLLERDGMRAFITHFASGHIAIVQRDQSGKYTVKGAMDRINKYGRPSKGKWPDMTRIKKLLSPAVPHMLGNEEIRENARELLQEVLDQEIEKRIRKALERAGAA